MECKHEMPIDQCFDCKPRPAKQAFSARYESACAFHLCSGVIDVGDMVVWNDEGTRVQHERH